MKHPPNISTLKCTHPALCPGLNGRQDEAFDLLRRAYTLARAHNNMGMIYRMRGKTEKRWACSGKRCDGVRSLPWPPGIWRGVKREKTGNKLKGTAMKRSAKLKAQREKKQAQSVKLKAQRNFLKS